MREKVEGGGRRVRLAPLVAWSLTAIMCAAISGNALFGQPAASRMAQAATDPAQDGPEDLNASDGARTIQLKFDPVVEAVQRELLSAGYYKGPVDGVIGRRTRLAITAYQQAMGLEPDGKPTPDLAEHIRFTREVSEASRATVRRVQTGLADLAYSPGEINGELTSDTRNAIITFQHDHHLPETGEVSDDLVAELAKVSGQSGGAAQ